MLTFLRAGTEAHVFLRGAHNQSCRQQKTFVVCKPWVLSSCVKTTSAVYVYRIFPPHIDDIDSPAASDKLRCSIVVPRGGQATEVNL